MNEFGWAITILLSVFGGLAGWIYKIHAKVGGLDTRVALLEDKDISGQLALLTITLETFRTESRELTEQNSEKLWKKMEQLRLELKGDLKNKADKDLVDAKIGK